MCKKCDELRTKVETLIGDKLTEKEFFGIKLIAALGESIEEIVEAVKDRRENAGKGVKAEIPAEIGEAVHELLSALGNDGMASYDEVSEILGRKMTDIEETKGYMMAKEGKSAQEIAKALQAAAGEDNLPDDLKKLVAQARAAGAEVKIVRIELDEPTPTADQLKAAMDSLAEDDQPEAAAEDEDDEVEVIAIAMFEEDGTPVSVDMVKYEDYLELEETAVDAVEDLEEAKKEIEKLKAQVARLKELRDAVGKFANDTFTGASGEGARIRAGQLLVDNVLSKFPDLYK